MSVFQPAAVTISRQPEWAVRRHFNDLVLSAAVGFTWWSLGLTIVAALALGYVLHLGAEILEVPISAMLILSVDTRAAATSRIVETLVGAGPACSRT